MENKMAKTKDVLMDHDYDGIKELDNDLPPWWLWLFYITIIWSAIYLVHYHVLGTGKSVLTKYQEEMDPNYAVSVESHSGGLFSRYHSPFHNPTGEVTPKVKKQFDRYIGPEIGFEELLSEAMRRADADALAKLQNTFPEMYATLETHGGPVTPKAATAGPVGGNQEKQEYEALSDAASLAAGKEIYTVNCATCHGHNGEGGIGPNMTDDYWIHGAGMANMMHIIKVGIPAKGMISWRPILDEEKMLQVASYMNTFYGTTPPNGKKPQGEQVDMTQYQ
jgi:mono/diheme cytochrome c family protein